MEEAYVDFSGDRIRADRRIRGILLQNAEKYGEIAANYARGVYFHDPIVNEYGAFQFSKLAGHCALLVINSRR